MTTAPSITVRVPLTIRRRPGRKTVVMPMRLAGDAAVTTQADPSVLKALARAFRYQRMLDEGRYASISEMAAAERIERGYLGSLLRLTLLAPDFVEAILDGQGTDCVALPALIAARSSSSRKEAVAPRRPQNRSTTGPSVSKSLSATRPPAWFGRRKPGAGAPANSAWISGGTGVPGGAGGPLFDQTRRVIANPPPRR
jgi:hypothetical protein